MVYKNSNTARNGASIHFLSPRCLRAVAAGTPPAWQAATARAFGARFFAARGADLADDEVGLPAAELGKACVFWALLITVSYGIRGSFEVAQNVWTKRRLMVGY